ncbi:hypothetical protein CFP56_003780 [Quercus suber]|uniref:Uncharacterized protein n=1 Tax=Quercus suber TaxID=58331 RepID=A0AAW0LCP7_QUESU
MAMIKCKHNIEITGPENKNTWNFHGTVDILDLLRTFLTFLVLARLHANSSADNTIAMSTSCRTIFSNSYTPFSAEEIFSNWLIFFRAGTK